jgi:hypothetical protein
LPSAHSIVFTIFSSGNISYYKLKCRSLTLQAA